ncbi:septum formation protein Maf [Candidatus Falkowbacteria bacterium]|nr:septum formation protein Maf [Candidatus Falkowbacteria bacterium]
MQKRRIILASRSPRRKKLLEQVGLEFEICESNFDEDSVSLADPIELAKFLALKKAEAVAARYDDAIIIGADSVVIFNDQALGKPKNSAEAKRILSELSGKENKGITGYAIIDTKNKIVVNNHSEAVVKFRDLSDLEIDEYVATGEPLDMAGAYGLMDRGATLMDTVSGNFYSIVGLPINEVYIELRKMGAV